MLHWSCKCTCMYTYVAHVCFLCVYSPIWPPVLHSPAFTASCTHLEGLSLWLSLPFTFMHAVVHGDVSSQSICTALLLLLLHTVSHALSSPILCPLSKSLHRHAPCHTHTCFLLQPRIYLSLLRALAAKSLIFSLFLTFPERSFSRDFPSSVSVLHAHASSLLPISSQTCILGIWMVNLAPAPSS